jgi:hypothetical protein
VGAPACRNQNDNNHLRPIVSTGVRTGAIKRLQPKIGEPATRRQPRPGPAPVSQRKSGFNAKDDCGIATSRSFIATPFQIILQEAWARASTPSNMITERAVFY